MAGKSTMQDIVIDHLDELVSKRALSAPQYRAANAIRVCRTPAMGGHEQVCPDRHFVRTQYHSCKHRSCPQCAESLSVKVVPDSC